ncbi:MAG: YdiU family protein [Alphaproteobacteria bacterium]|nr:YdiU family protein [Alphaproteobacteria bacterium]MBL6936951.1 YdiU family protein [Alphaproteobacteria bacterium]MBL7097720.1 YdiU family protein [Alphaproteobacteria bacterium]
MVAFGFDNSYARLPERFHARLPPTPVAAPKLIKVNAALARFLGLDPSLLASDEGVAMLAGNRVPEGAEPLAMAYAGHQFGNWVPQLGDGRAILLGELRGGDGVRYDVQLKGSGPTPFSRNGDGRAALGPVLREFIVSEAMHALGVPTTRTLAAVTTGEEIWRQEGMLPGAVLTRVSRSHVRVGTFEYFGNHDDVDGVKVLADYVMARLYPDVDGYAGLLEAVIGRTAKLIAQWQLIGFIHGVMNTDNTSIAGETIDYGPCAFMDAYDPQTVFSSIDHGGRYAYINQPRIAHWNLVRFAQALLPLLADGEEAQIKVAQAIINRYPAMFEAAYFAGLRAKFGFAEAREGDLELIAPFLKHMADGRADFTLAFRRLSDSAEDAASDTALGALFDNDAAVQAWLPKWRERLAVEETVSAAERADSMRAVNPALIPRNHRIEQAIQAAQRTGDLAPFETLMKVLSAPYVDQPEFAAYANPPKPDERVLQTFCGT